MSITRFFFYKFHYFCNDGTLSTSRSSRLRLHVSVSACRFRRPGFSVLDSASRSGRLVLCVLVSASWFWRLGLAVSIWAFRSGRFGIGVSVSVSRSPFLILGVSVSPSQSSAFRSSTSLISASRLGWCLAVGSCVPWICEFISLRSVSESGLNRRVP